MNTIVTDPGTILSSIKFLQYKVKSISLDKNDGNYQNNETCLKWVSKGNYLLAVDASPGEVTVGFLHRKRPSLSNIPPNIPSPFVKVTLSELTPYLRTVSTSKIINATYHIQLLVYNKSKIYPMLSWAEIYKAIIETIRQRMDKKWLDFLDGKIQPPDGTGQFLIEKLQMSPLLKGTNQDRKEVK